MSKPFDQILQPSAEAKEEALARARRIAEGLFPHQVEGVAFLLGRLRSILADDMGLGKTRQAIIALTESRPQGPYLVVCPASVKYNWAREILLVRPGAEVRIVGKDDVPERPYSGWVVVNYDILQRHDEALLKHPWSGLVFDEAHYLKNRTSKRSVLGRQLVEQCGDDAVVFCLTGTPLTNRPRDLFPLLQLVGHPLSRSFLTFAKRYCDAKHNGYGWATDGASNLEELAQQLHGVMLRRRKEDVLSLPPKLRTRCDVELKSGTALAETRQALEFLIGSRLSGAARVDGPRSDRARLLGYLTKARNKLAVAKVPHTIEIVQNAIDQEEKVIVFSCYDQPVKKIADYFGDAAVLLTGATPTAKRQELVDRFQKVDSVRVFVANIVAGGVGINLTAACQVVFNDLDWVPANHWQAEDRAYRIGQTQTVQATYVVGLDSLDEFVWTVLERKAALVSAVVEGKALDPSVTRDILSDLEEALGQLSPGLLDTIPNRSDPDYVKSVLEELLKLHTSDVTLAGAATQEGRSALLPDEALRALARVLSGPSRRVFVVKSNSDPTKSYKITESGPDLFCDCPGFEYRGTCSHVRKLQPALVAGKALPAGYAIHGEQ